MNSTVRVTFEMDDLSLTVKQLTAGIGSDFKLERNSVGILYCYSDFEVEELADSLQAELSFPIIGSTAVATLDRKNGLNELAATLMVLTADDCEFNTAVTQPLTVDDTVQKIQQAYSQVSAEKPPELIIAFAPYSLDIMVDKYAEAFNTVAPGVAVCGGVTSFNSVDSCGHEGLIIYHGKTYSDSMAIISITGNIRPLFSVQVISSSPVERKRKVTEADGGIIYKVGNEKFTDYLKDVGLPVEKLAKSIGTIAFSCNPLQVEYPLEDGAKPFSYFRTLHEINLEEGSGTSVGGVPLGATISVNPMTRQDISKTALEAMAQLEKKIMAASEEVSEYRYSTILAISCVARFMVMIPNSGEEASQLKKIIPDGMVMSGYYSNGELGPVQAEGVPRRTFAYNESIILCAF